MIRWHRNLLISRKYARSVGVILLILSVYALIRRTEVRCRGTDWDPTDVGHLWPPNIPTAIKITNMDKATGGRIRHWWEMDMPMATLCRQQCTSHWWPFITAARTQGPGTTSRRVCLDKPTQKWPLQDDTHLTQVHGTEKAANPQPLRTATTDSWTSAAQVPSHKVYCQLDTASTTGRWRSH